MMRFKGRPSEIDSFLELLKKMYDPKTSVGDIAERIKKNADLQKVQHHTEKVAD